MSTKNELIDVINSARTNGAPVKSIRRQKYDPNNFYMTLSDGKQIGPVKAEGAIEELDRKFNEAQSQLDAQKNKQTAPRKAA
jgi:hypothetical protein